MLPKPDRHRQRTTFRQSMIFSSSVASASRIFAVRGYCHACTVSAPTAWRTASVEVRSSLARLSSALCAGPGVSFPGVESGICRQTVWPLPWRSSCGQGRLLRAWVTGVEASAGDAGRAVLPRSALSVVIGCATSAVICTSRSVHNSSLV